MKNMDTRVAMLAIIIALLGFTTCATTAVSCWKRGGTVLRNAFDWPVCVEVSRR